MNGPSSLTGQVTLDLRLGRGGGVNQGHVIEELPGDRNSLQVFEVGVYVTSQGTPQKHEC